MYPQLWKEKRAALQMDAFAADLGRDHRLSPFPELLFGTDVSIEAHAAVEGDPSIPQAPSFSLRVSAGAFPLPKGIR